MFAVHRDVHHGPTGFFDRSLKLRQILRIRGRKVPRPGFDLVDLKLLNYVGGEILQIHGLRGFALLSCDELAEGIGGYGDALPRLCRKLQVRSRGGMGQRGSQPNSGRCGRASLQKSSSSKWRQAGQSSTVVHRVCGGLRHAGEGARAT